MNRSACIGIIAGVTLTLLASHATANIPDPTLSRVPRFITIAPDGGGPNALVVEIDVIGSLGGVDGAFVEIEFSEEATALLAWADPIPSQADVPTQFCPNRTYGKVTDAAGVARFYIAGGGCIRSEDFPGRQFIVQVRADNIVLAEREVNSPDVVNGEGRLCTDIVGPICDAGRMSVGLSDGVFHAAFGKSGIYEKCSDLWPPYGGYTGLEDLVLMTLYIQAGTTASCSAGCP